MVAIHETDKLRHCLTIKVVTLKCFFMEKVLFCQLILTGTGINGLSTSNAARSPLVM